MNVNAKVSLFQQVLIILLFSLGMGFAVNGLRSTSLPLVGGWSSSPVKGDIPAVSLEDAVVKFLSDEALFLDARSTADYQRGHIKGAVNLPVRDGSFGQRLQEFSGRVDHQRELIVYCDGTDSPLSPQLASILRGLGFRNVKILLNGWNEWFTAGMPFETE
jgi:rhodanese-related sulfurtransferase